MATIVAAQAGNTNATATWTGGVCPGPSDDVDINGFAIVQAGGALTLASLTDGSIGKTGTFEITDDYTDRDGVTCPIFCNTTKEGDVPIQLDVSVSVDSSSPAFENQALGLVDVGSSTFVNVTGVGVNNHGTIVGTVLDATTTGSIGISNTGIIQCDAVDGTGGYGNGVYNTGEITCDTLTGIAGNLTEDNAGIGVFNNAGGVIVCPAVFGQADVADGIVNYGTITGAVEATTVGGDDGLSNAGTITGSVTVTGVLVNSSGTINLIGVLGISNGTIQSAYTLPPTDIIGAGML